jgi:hypothetical protein
MKQHATYHEEASFGAKSFMKEIRFEVRFCEKRKNTLER